MKTSRLKKIMIIVLIFCSISALGEFTYFPSIKLPHYKKQNSKNIKLAIIKIVDENNNEIDLLELFKPNELHIYQYSMKYLQFSENPDKILKYITHIYNKKNSKKEHLEIKSTLIKLPH